jgi:hypothetical protein
MRIVVDFFNQINLLVFLPFLEALENTEER